MKFARPSLWTRSVLRMGLGLVLVPWMLSATASADILCLKDGRVLEGVKMTRTDRGVVVHFENGNVEVHDDAIRECVIEDEVFEPVTDEDEKMLEKGFVRWEGDWVSPRRRERELEDLVEEQRERLERTIEMREWRNRLEEETDNFAFESTVAPHIFESYRDLCETYFEVFCKDWKIRKPRDLDRLPLKFFVDRDLFNQVTGVGGGVLGFFQFVVPPYELCIFYDRLDPRGTEEVMYHEVGHYLHKLIDPEFKYPHWPGEALCEYYGASEWDPVEKELTTGLINEGRLAWIRHQISLDQWVGLKEMILGCQDRNFHDYSWGWSFVHMLLSDRKRAKNFKKFFLALADGRDIDRHRMSFGKYQFKSVGGEEMLEAFMKYMKIDDEEELEELEKEWYDYIQNELVITSSRGFESAAALNKRLGRPLAAIEFYEKAIEQGTENAVTYFQLAEALAVQGKADEARKHWEKAIQLDPMTPEFYISLGEYLIRRPDDSEKNEGKRLVRLAMELEPNNYYLANNAKRLLED